MIKKAICIFSLSLFVVSCKSQHHAGDRPDDRIIPAAERTSQYLPLLKDRHIALVANHTSLIGDVHLVDSLLKLGIRIDKIFSPEHGFRGMEDAGYLVDDETDKGTGIPLISLYGKVRKPGWEDLQGIDMVVFDIQDVGVRFYTYISTLHYVMEACAKNGISLLVLDRPNPNGFYIDGPVLEDEFRSFVGMHPVPVVHGLTIAEYAGMINGESWLKNGLECDLHVILCDNYTHDSLYHLTVFPSPNLKSMRAVYLYPSLGFFEGTIINVGRGTSFPFEVYGHPGFPDSLFRYIPASVPGAEHPKHQDEVCYGIDLRHVAAEEIANNRAIMLKYLEHAWQLAGQDSFFIPYFNLLSGNKMLRSQIKSGIDIDTIKFDWQNDLSGYKELRQKYLLYPDFTE